MTDTFQFIENGEDVCLPCAICDGHMTEVMRDVQFSLDKQRTIDMARYSICHRCGVVQKFPLPSSATLKSYYQNSWQDSLARPREFFDATADWIAGVAYLADGNRAIDIGSKGRHMADAMTRVGIELDWTTVERSENGSEVEKLWVGDGLVPSRAYGFVCASHVLEHTHDPVTFIRDVLGMLTDNGVAYIEVPSIEAHSEDSGTCDDVNQNHLWHFSINSLCRLIYLAGGVILATAICRARRNPANRLLISRQAGVATETALRLKGLTDCITLEYAEAAHRLSKADPKKVCLYAASNSYLRLMSLYPDLVRRFDVFDLYFRGEIQGIQVRDPKEIHARGYATALITTRVWAPAHEIKRWISANLPGITPVALFPMVEEFQPKDT